MQWQALVPWVVCSLLPVRRVKALWPVLRQSIPQEQEPEQVSLEPRLRRLSSTERTAPWRWCRV
jgi:hypothetical protein